MFYFNLNKLYHFFIILTCLFSIKLYIKCTLGESKKTRYKTIKVTSYEPNTRIVPNGLIKRPFIDIPASSGFTSFRA